MFGYAIMVFTIAYAPFTAVRCKNTLC
jgi:hypothetical protein